MPTDLRRKAWKIEGNRSNWNLNQKREMESESDSDSESEPRVIYDWELKRPEDLVASDFWMYEDDPKPFAMGAGRFEYKNKAWIEREKKIKIAMDDYRERSRNLTVSVCIYLILFSISCFTILVLTLHNTVVRCHCPSRNCRYMWRCNSPSLRRG